MKTTKGSVYTLKLEVVEKKIQGSRGFEFLYIWSECDKFRNEHPLIKKAVATALRNYAKHLAGQTVSK